MSKLTSRAILAANRVFSVLSGETLDRVAMLANRRDAPRGTVLFTQDDPGDALYGIISGRVRISSLSPEGRQLHLLDLGSGEMFGEIALLDGGPRTASATVTERAALFRIDRRSFGNLLEQEPHLAVRLLEALCERLRWTSELAEDLSLLSVEGKIAKRLHLLLGQFGTESERGRELAIAQADLAAFLGLSRQAVNMQLQEWRKEGWLELSRNRIIIRAVDRLEDIYANPASTRH